MQPPHKPNWMRRGAMLLLLAAIAGLAWFNLSQGSGGGAGAGEGSTEGAGDAARRLSFETGQPADWLVIVFILSILVGLLVAFALLDWRARKRASSAEDRP
jgi:hypothetical protein